MEQYLFFSVDGLSCGIPLPDVISMIRIIEVNPEKDIKPGVIGTINYYSLKMPVYSLRYLFGYPDRSPLLSDELIIVQKKHEKVALWVDETYTIQEGEIVVDLLSLSEKKNYNVPGLTLLKSGLVILHDLSEFLDDSPLSTLRLTDIRPSKEFVTGKTQNKSSEICDYYEIKKVLKERANQINAPEEVIEKSSFIDVIRFNLMNQEYAVEMKYIREVIGTPDIIPVPGTPDYIAGICSVRGEIISLVDIRILFSIEQEGVTDLNQVIVLTDGNLTFGILTDQISGIGTVKEFDLTFSDNDYYQIMNKQIIEIEESITFLNVGALLKDPRMVVNNDEYN